MSAHCFDQETGCDGWALCGCECHGCNKAEGCTCGPDCEICEAEKTK